jgi:signal transduction histidine kinase
MHSPEDNLIAVQTHKEITRLYKTFLELVEDIRSDNEAMVKKVAEKCGPEVAKDVNYLTQEKYEQIRKRVLDSGNECARQMINFLEFFDFIINKEKVETAASQRRIVKKVTVSGLLMQKD